MSRVVPAKEICERALRAIGSFPITESAADGEHVREAMHWLDLILAETVGTTRMFSRVESTTLSMEITNGTQTYDLFTELGEDLPEDRIQYITDAYVEDSQGNRTRVDVVQREEFENVDDIDETGPVRRILFDRKNTTPSLSIFPVPATTDSETYTLKIVCQLYAPNVAPGGVTGNQPDAAVLHGFGVAWQRWLVCQLAHDLGSGPIVKLSESSLNRFLGMAGVAKAALTAFENREHETTAPVCEAWGM